MLRATDPSAVQGSPHGLEELPDISSSLTFPGTCPYFFWPRSMVPEDGRESGSGCTYLDCVLKESNITLLMLTAVFWLYNSARSTPLW